jgi:type I pantothenate kinase
VSSLDLAPFHTFTRLEWAALRAGTPLTLSEADLARVQSLNDPLSLEEVETIYLPLARLLLLHFAAQQQLFAATHAFLLTQKPQKIPYIIGLAGSVAVGKSTTARLLQTLLQQLPPHPSVALVTTDGFLFPNTKLEALGLMDRKGFPESYDTPALLAFLSQTKAGAADLEIPTYSHLHYDVMYERERFPAPDILILEGLNVLQPARLPREGRAVPFVSDFFDFSIYLDADEPLLRDWYIERFMRLRETAFRNPLSFFKKYADLETYDAERVARRLWQGINLPNLQANILPTRPRANLILSKSDDHQIARIALRKV